MTDNAITLSYSYINIKTWQSNTKDHHMIKYLPSKAESSLSRLKLWRSKTTCCSDRNWISTHSAHHTKAASSIPFMLQWPRYLYTTSLHLGSHMNYFQLQSISYTMGLFARGRVGPSSCPAGPTHNAQFPWRKQCLENSLRHHLSSQIWI
jgi:hypothetical protein